MVQFEGIWRVKYHLQQWVHLMKNSKEKREKSSKYVYTCNSTSSTTLAYILVLIVTVTGMIVMDFL